MKKYTTEEFIEKAKIVHGDKYNYSKAEYKSIKEKIIIICPDHGEFYLDPSNHLAGKGCPKCGIIKYSSKRKLTTEDFIKKAQLVHGNKYNYSKTEYSGIYNNVHIICPIHGEFLLNANSHLSGCGCQKCSNVYSLTEKEFIDSANRIHNNVYDYSDLHYDTSNKRVKIICKEHGEFWLYRTLHLRGSGCQKCAAKVRGKTKRKTTKLFIKEAIKVHGNLYDYSKTDYMLGRQKVIISCKKHGDFLQLPVEHLLGSGCPHCLRKGQTILYNKLHEVFPELEIIFEASKKVIPWIGLQRLDIYFPSINVAVEYDGPQHYNPVEFFGGKKEYEYIVIKDKLKEECCKHNGCSLFRISSKYTDKDFLNLVHNVKQIYDSKLNCVGNF